MGWSEVELELDLELEEEGGKGPKMHGMNEQNERQEIQKSHFKISFVNGIIFDISIRLQVPWPVLMGKTSCTR
jgi:hypothetical protein